ncbi:protein kinase [Paenibacillus assamensis]|uniref:protein kinase n=1 Tax=Paenibacillus assamensis TaxID=311244 RepID=UPI000422E024|nr:protein kinase [Paenibacillus assamensis]
MSIDVKSRKFFDDPQLINKLKATDLAIDVCGSDCLLHSIKVEDDTIYPISVNNEKIIVGLLASNNIILPLKANNWSGHHLYGYPVIRDLESRYQIMNKLVGTEHKNIVPIKAVCKCCVEIQFLDGVQLDDNIWSFNHQVRKYDIKSFNEFLNTMLQLAQGLDFLHKQGIAHTDPVPTNVIMIADGTPVWIDLNDCIHLDEFSLSLDLAVFYSLTWLTKLSEMTNIDEALVAHIEELFINADDSSFLENFANILFDYLSASDENRLTKVKNRDVKLYDGLNVADSHLKHRVLISRNIAHRNMFFLKWQAVDNIHSIRNYEALLKSEVHRHMLLELEYDHANRERIAWIKQLEEGKSWLEGQYNNWKERASALEEERDSLNRSAGSLLVENGELKQKLLENESREALHLNEINELKSQLSMIQGLGVLDFIKMKYSEKGGNKNG